MLNFFDITPKEYSLTQNIWCLFLYGLIIVLFYDSNVCGIKKWNNPRYHHVKSLLLLFFVYSLTNFVDHDYWGYYEAVKFDPIDEAAHVEAVYTSIIRFFNRNYLIFRTLVWGGALYIFYIGAKIAKIDTYHSLYLLAILFIVLFTYGRVSLAMAMVFTGYIMFYNYKRKNPTLSCLGLCLFLTAFFFHKSIVIAMALSIIMTYIPITKRTVVMTFLCMPILFIGIKSFTSYILETGLGLSEETASTALRYSGYVRESANLKGKIREVFEYGRFYIPILIGIKMLFMERKEALCPPIILNLFKISIGLVFIGTCFFFMGFDNNVFAYRIMYMAMIPLVYSFVEFYRYQIITRRQYTTVIWIGIFGTGYGILYGVYSLL